MTESSPLTPAVNEALAHESDPEIHIRDLVRERTRARLFGASQPFRVGRFTLLEPVGRGGMGTVFAAYDPQLDRRVAIKLIHGVDRQPNDDGNASWSQQALAEARSMARVTDPNVVGVYEVGEYNGLPRNGASSVFIAMEFVAGKTLRAWVTEETPEAVAIIARYVDAARGLAAVHGAGLVHRDFKPDNAMVDEAGRVRVMDFGVARSRAPPCTHPVTQGREPSVEAVATHPGRIVGTPAYMAPEQLRGAVADPRCDQFAWCVALYEALAGQRPTGVASQRAHIERLLGSEPLPELPSSVRVHPRVREVLRRGLAFAPADRWPSMAAIIDVLDVRNSRRWLWLPAVVVAGLAGVVVVENRSSVALCTGSDAIARTSWNPDVAAGVRAALQAHELPYAERDADGVLSTLDTYADTWAVEHREICLATRVRGERTEATMGRRMACLDRRRGEFDALVAELRAIEAGDVPQAMAAAEGLTSPTGCRAPGFADPTRLQISDTLTLAQRDEVRTELARLGSIAALGRHAEAYAASGDLLARADELGDIQTLAAVRLEHAQRSFAAGALQQSIDAAKQAYREARRAGRPGIATEAALGVASGLGTHHLSAAQLEAAEQWLEVGRIEAELGGIAASGPLARTRARLLARRGKWKEAIEAMVGAAEALVLDRGNCDELVERYREIAGHYGQLQDVQGQARYAALALSVARSLHDETHPVVISTLRERADVASASGDHDLAVEMLAKLVTTRHQTLGLQHPNTAIARSDYAGALARAGRTDEGVEQLRRALATLEAGEHSHAAASGYNRLATIQASVGRLGEARQSSARAVELLEALFPDGHPDLARTLFSRASVLAELREDEAALAMRLRARSMRNKTDVRDDELALYDTAIARSCLTLGRTAEARNWIGPVLENAPKLDFNRNLVNAYLIAAEANASTAPELARAALETAQARCEVAQPASATAAGCERLAGALQAIVGRPGPTP